MMNREWMEIKIKIEEDGRILLPEEVRDKFHLTHESELLLITKDDEIILKNFPPKISLEEVLATPLKFDPKKALTMDIANWDETNIEEN